MSIPKGVMGVRGPVRVATELSAQAARTRWGLLSRSEHDKMMVATALRTRRVEPSHSQRI
ncbi:hypothetical protein Taro_052820 [Colocasia esculenta]|uniref:Uncharacterized protein n=1 Tax=Colocasia esculenta TaxID=4460 RepID=A0A843XLC1_COLES|nr:hypothetical protein [Colocasia esculenta]